MAKSDLLTSRLHAENARSIELVAQRMRQTLIEVEGEEVGRALYSMDWLQQRVRWHLNPDQCDGAVFLAVREGCASSQAAVAEAPNHGEVAGHLIVRVEQQEEGQKYGLISTIYVEPDTRRSGVGERLMRAGEDWLRGKKLLLSTTWTSAANAKLISLLKGRGYQIHGRSKHDTTGTEMVNLARTLDP